MKRWLLIFLMAITCVPVCAQLLRASYEKKGKVKAAGGLNFYHIEIKLNEDGIFTYRTIVFEPTQNTVTPLSDDVTSGKWFVKHDTLFLDYNPEATDAKKQSDVYLIKLKRLKRITFRTEKAFFRATGDILKE